MLQAPLASARDVRQAVAEIIRPPRRLKPSEAATQYLRNDRGQWSAELAPMVVEPLDDLGGRECTGVVFVGPARTGKTFGLIHAGLTYIVTCSPGDTLVVQMSQDTARDFSRMELDRVIRASPALQERISPRARDDNTYDKFFRSGMAIKLGWPAVSQLSSKTLKYVFITDYDRPENRDNVDGEGPLWDLGHKRVTTYMSRGKCLAESSPGEVYLNPNWKPATPHEGPPARGIASLYNRGTRARWYWPCLGCGEFWEPKPGVEPFALPDFDDLEKLVVREDLMSLAHRYAKAVCPHCGSLHEMEHRAEMNARATWAHEGQVILPNGTREGEPRETPFRSYWLGGAAAPYQRWDSMLYQYLQGVLTYVRTGDEEPLKTTTNTDQGACYMPRAMAKRRSVEQLMKRAQEEDWPEGTVPEGVRFLTAQVDVQGNRFEVLVQGWGVGLQSWPVDRFSITSSVRMEGDRNAALDPSAYLEDWMQLVPEVLQRTYGLESDSSVTLPVRAVAIDSGGKAGVTEKAYECWRALRRRGLARGVFLVKGDHRIGAPRVKETWPDSKGRRRARSAAAQGDVPVWLLNVNVLKDGVAGDLSREVPGPGYIHLPRWMPVEYFEELTAEIRTDKGWKVPKQGTRNEAFDLHVYGRALIVIMKAENIDWEKPPSWAREPREAPPATPRERKRSLASLADEMNG